MLEISIFPVAFYLFLPLKKMFPSPSIFFIFPIPPSFTPFLSPLCVCLVQYDRIGECLIFMTSLVGLVQHQAMPFLPLKVSDVLLLLHLPDNIELWDPSDPMTAFWDISGQVRNAICT